ncbi:MAG: hypothetical protein IKZ22_04830, partial [Kiritimatiellae bacterium]|nr:hypothetical protein [Kiritimatiellia bacterium]
MTFTRMLRKAPVVAMSAGMWQGACFSPSQFGIISRNDGDVLRCKSGENGMKKLFVFAVVVTAALFAHA